ncbi:MAG: phosphoribosylformylglycinamidine synthase I [Dictyoglomus sp.]|nr:phosphoribosylformylglycinamidine synthase I [Dictyoglomus sp.]MCX7941725.1 phosphoribosylformylglycinamidine synthase I [Dictyoglomaceae bacterium]MDW8189018.1 phosphoribosylformylglycinamidine synthase I [Dictyoglomus sp.]
MRVGIVVFPGTNCDYDTFWALKLAGLNPVFLWHKEKDLKDVSAVILPGGFSYGDYLRAGAIARFSPLIDRIFEFAEKGGLVLGICNGFQILLEMGLLPGAMLPNDTNTFICKPVYLKVENNDSPFLRKYQVGEILKMPIAHKEGRYYIPERDLLALEREGQVVLRYVGPKGESDLKFNPNGSVNNIAGIVNKKRNVMGLMPHPERAVEKLLGSDSGLRLFLSLLD